MKPRVPGLGAVDNCRPDLDVAAINAGDVDLLLPPTVSEFEQELARQARHHRAASDENRYLRGSVAE